MSVRVWVSSMPIVLYARSVPGMCFSLHYICMGFTWPYWNPIWWYFYIFIMHTLNVYKRSKQRNPNPKLLEYDEQRIHQISVNRSNPFTLLLINTNHTNLQWEFTSPLLLWNVNVVSYLKYRMHGYSSSCTIFHGCLCASRQWVVVLVCCECPRLCRRRRWIHICGARWSQYCLWSAVSCQGCL